MPHRVRIIRKYANRRLYDTSSSQSITLNDVRDLIGNGEPVQVIEAKTGRDVTRSVLLQIVADQEMLGRPVLSNEFLEAMIRVTSNPMRDMARDYLQQVMLHLESQQQNVDAAWSRALRSSGLGDIGQLTPEPLRQLQQRLFTLWSDAIKPPLRDEPEADTDEDASDR